MLKITQSYSVTLTVTDNKGAKVSNIVTIVVSPDPNLIPSPSNLSVTTSKTSITLFWSDNSNNEQGFYIERGLKSKGTTNYQRIGQVGTNITTYTETVAANTYYYRVQAFNLATGKVSGYSNVLQVRISAK